MSARQVARALGQVALAQSPWAPSPRPRAAREVTADYLADLFRPQAPGARPLGIEVVGGNTGTTERQRLREVSYFLTHSVPTELRRAHQDDLVRLYLDALHEDGVAEPPTLDQAWDGLRHFAFDAWDSSAICLVWPGLQAPANVEVGVARAHATVVDWEVDAYVAALC